MYIVIRKCNVWYWRKDHFSMIRRQEHGYSLNMVQDQWRHIANVGAITGHQMSNMDFKITPLRRSKLRMRGSRRGPPDPPPLLEFAKYVPSWYIWKKLSYQICVLSKSWSPWGKKYWIRACNGVKITKLWHLIPFLKTRSHSQTKDS